MRQHADSEATVCWKHQGRCRHNGIDAMVGLCILKRSILQQERSLKQCDRHPHRLMEIPSFPAESMHAPCSFNTINKRFEECLDEETRGEST